MLYGDMKIGSSAMLEVERFAKYCREKGKDPLEKALACFVAAQAYVNALADAGRVKDAKRVLNFEEGRWRVTYAYLAGRAVTCEADMPPEMRAEECA